MFEYHLTKAAASSSPWWRRSAVWGQRWVETELSLQHLDVSLLMWDMRRNLDPTPMPKRAQRDPVPLSGAAAGAAIMVAVGGRRTADVDLCSVDPGFDVDLYVSTDLRTMTAIWMGFDKYASCSRRSADDADRRSPARLRHASLARP